MKQMDKVSGRASRQSADQPGVPSQAMSNQDLHDALDGLMRHRPDGGRLSSRPDLMNELSLYQIELELQNRELQSTQAVLEESRERYAELYDYAPVGYVTLNNKGVVQDINLTAASMLGRERSHVVGQPFSTCMPAGQCAALFSFLYRVAESGGPDTLETKLCFADNELHDVRFVGIARPDPVPGALHCRIAMCDISAEKRQQETLRLHSLIMDNMLEGVMLSSQGSGIILETNPAFDHMFGYSRGELIGREISQLYPGQSASAVSVQEQINSAMRSAGYWEGEMESCGKDGAVFWSESSIHVFEHAQHGKVWLTVQRNIMARKQAEYDIQSRQDALAHMARINTVGELAASLAHELTQPLMAIEHLNNAALQALQSAHMDAQEEALNLLQSADQQVQRAGKIISHLRRFIRKGAVNKQPTQLPEVISAAMGLMQPMLRDHSVEVAVRLGKDLPMVNIDPIQIEQVLVNLLRNSIEALSKPGCEERRINIDVSLQGPEIRLTINDSGPGLGTLVAENLFDILESHKSDGMGMGLAISRSLIKAHGGRLWADAQTHAGAVFHFTLPAIME